MSRAPRDIDELLELAGDDPADFAKTLEADGRAEGDPTKVEEARMVRRAASKQRASARAPHDASPTKKQKPPPARKATSPEGKSLAKANRQKQRAGKAGVRVRSGTVKPRAMVSSTIDTGGSMFWTLALGTVALIFLSLVVRNADTAVRMFDALGNGVRNVTHPRRVFGDQTTASQPSTTTRKARS